MRSSEPHFSAFDEPTEPSKDSYALPLEDWNRAVDMAQWMSNLDTVSPLRRRMKTFLEAGGQATLMKTAKPPTATVPKTATKALPMKVDPDFKRRAAEYDKVFAAGLNKAVTREEPVKDGPTPQQLADKRA